MTDHTEIPDNKLDDVLCLTTPEQFEATRGSTRPKILRLGGQRAATTNTLAAGPGLPTGAVRHHREVLEATRRREPAAGRGAGVYLTNRPGLPPETKADNHCT